MPQGNKSGPPPALVVVRQMSTSSPEGANSQSSAPSLFGGSNRSQAWLLLLSALYLYLNLFRLPNLPYFQAGDQTFFWSDALRLLDGQHAYRDFFQFTTPGTDFLYLFLFRMLGTNILVANLAVLLVGVGLCFLCYRVARHLMDHDWALVTAAVYLVLLYSRVLDATHHWFSLAAVIGALWVLLPERTARRVAAAGALLGLASFFTQTAGVAGLLGLLIALQLERRFTPQPSARTMRLQLLLVLTFVLTCACWGVYFIADAGWKQLWYLWVSYPLHNVVSSSWSLHNRALVAALLVTYIAALCYPFLRKSAPAANPMPSLLLALPGLFLIMGVIAKPNWHRIYMVAMPAVILVMSAIAHHSSQRRYAKSGLVALLAGAALWHTLSIHRQARDLVLLPGGQRVLVEKSDSPEFAWLAQHTMPGDLFLDAPWPLLYLPLQLRSPVFVDGLLNDQQTPASYVERTLRELAATPAKFILWVPRLSGDAYSPAHALGSAPDPLTPIRTYLTRHYTRIHVFAGGDEIWQLQETNSRGE